MLKWLEAKVQRLAKVLQDKEIPCGAVARSKLLKKEKDENDIRSYEGNYMFAICSIIENNSTTEFSSISMRQVSSNVLVT